MTAVSLWSWKSLLQQGLSVSHQSLLNVGGPGQSDEDPVGAMIIQRKERVAAPPIEERVLIAPEHLDLESRIEFRREAVSLLQAMREGAGRLVVDLSGTRSVDSAGLGTLILVQRRAARRRQVLRLRAVSEELHHLLVLTKLQDYFEIEGLDDS